MAEKIIFPQISGVNWPSTVLHAWLILHELGIPQHHLRFLPEVGHFAEPEVMEADSKTGSEDDSEDDENVVPRGTRYDSRTQRATVYSVDPEEVRPRIRVNVRAETVMRFYEDAEGREQCREDMVGRLAHFMQPLMVGLPDPLEHPDEDPLPQEKPLLHLTREVCGAFPELLATIPYTPRVVLEKVTPELEKALDDVDSEARGERVRQIAALIEELENPQAGREALLAMAEKIGFEAEDGLEELEARQAMHRFKGWADILFGADSKVRAQEIERAIEELTEQEKTRYRLLLHQLEVALKYENRPAREKIVLEMMEILTTEVFTATAVTDLLWGLGWIHGFVSDFRLNAGPVRQDGLFMSVTGGLGHRAVLLALVERWMREGAFLGVGTAGAASEETAVAGRERLDASLLNEEEQRELCALAAWRRESADPLSLFETAARRLIHPEVTAQLHRYMPAPSRCATLYAQPGSTAVLGGRARLQYPGILIHVPLSEDADEEAVRAKAVLTLLKRIFLPVCLRVEIIWQEAVGVLGRTAFLQHDFQQGVRLADPWTALQQSGEEESYDPITL